MIFIIGWRGEPNTNDEPQHKYQGEITLKLLDVLEIEYTVISKDTDVEELRSVMEKRRKSLSEGKNVAFVIRKESVLPSISFSASSFAKIDLA